MEPKTAPQHVAPKPMVTLHVHYSHLTLRGVELHSRTFLDGLTDLPSREAVIEAEQVLERELRLQRVQILSWRAVLA